MLTEQAGLCRATIPNFLRRRLNIQVCWSFNCWLELHTLSIRYNHRYFGIYSLAMKSLFIDICTGKAQRNVYMIYRRIEYS